VAETVARGRVDVTVKLKEEAETSPEIEVNMHLAESYYKALCRIKEALGTQEEVQMQMLLGFEGIISMTEPDVDLDRAWGIISSCVDEAVEGMDAMRISEGMAISHDFGKRLRSVEDGLSQVKAMAPTVLSNYHGRLEERIASLTEGKVELDPSRLAQETAFLAERSDITEEVVRAQSHVKQFHAMMESGDPAGRALDFLLQELNREINTIGSKVGDADLSHVVVALKSEVEKIREQVQNIE
jgi:uncharacterized protein (TIGR00255 family)